MDNKQNNKTLLLTDRVEINDKINMFDKRNMVKITNSETGEVIFEGSNKVIVSGAAFTARNHFDIPDEEITPSYNTALSLDNTLYITPTSIEKIFLFAVGTDGCGRENSQVYANDYKKWIMPDALVPFRYQPRNNDLDNNLRQLYYGKKTLSNKYAYYFKKFEADPVFHQKYIDGTPIDSTIYTNSNELAVESWIDLRLKVTSADCRDYFINTVGISEARVNTLSLLTAWYSEIDGYRYYQDIRPLTRLNFPNIPLIDLNLGIDIQYQLYY